MAKAAAGAAAKPTPAAKKTAPATTTEVVKKPTTALAVPAVNMEEDAGGGFEHATKDAYAIPFLAILQSGSPQCKKSEGAYIKGAEEGMFLNTVTQEVYNGDDEGVALLPCAYTMTYVEWGLREGNDKGFKGEYNVETGQSLMATTRKNEKNQDILPNGHQLNQTHNMYCLLLAGEVPQPVILSFTSTQIKKCKRWMTIANQLRLKKADGTAYQPPLFSHIYRAVTIPESNDKGSWMGWDVSVERPLDVTDHADATLYLEARKFKESIIKGEVKISSRDVEADASGSGNGDVEYDGEEM
jgi:hypothetical protein